MPINDIMNKYVISEDTLIVVSEQDALKYAKKYTDRMSKDSKKEFESTISELFKALKRNKIQVFKYSTLNVFDVLYSTSSENKSLANFGQFMFNGLLICKETFKDIKTLENILKTVLNKVKSYSQISPSMEVSFEDPSKPDEGPLGVSMKFKAYFEDI